MTVRRLLAIVVKFQCSFSNPIGQCPHNSHYKLNLVAQLPPLSISVVFVELIKPDNLARDLGKR